MPNLDKESLEVYQAYVDGINDFINNINLMAGEGSTTAKLLPPEFYLMNYTIIEPWTVVDSLSISKLLVFQTSWNWGQDLFRELIADSGLADMVDEIFPFTAEHSYNLVTVINDEEL